MRKLIIINAAPSSRIFGKLLDPYWLHNNGFHVELWDLSAMHHDQDSIAAYFSGAEGYRYEGPGHRYFHSRKALRDALAALSISDIIWPVNRTSYTLRDDFWLLRLLKKYGLKYIVAELENKIVPVAEGASTPDRFAGLLRKVVENRRILGTVLALRIKGWIMNHTSWYPDPLAYIGVGQEASRRFKKAFRGRTAFISIPSPLVEWDNCRELSDSGGYNLFVDESIAHAPDSKLFKRNICVDTQQYFQNISRAFSVIEAVTGKPVVIGASGKVDYQEDVFAGRKLVYGRTKSLIQQANLVIGHASSGLFQSVVNRKPVLIMNDPTFTVSKQKDVYAMASMFRLTPMLSTALQSTQVADAMTRDTSCYADIEEQYFRAKGVSGDWREIVARGLEEVFGSVTGKPSGNRL